jgi:chorismate dehydratase
VAPPSPLRVGCVKYLNARPLIRGWGGEVVFDHPAVLSEQLQRGLLDIALVSSFEFLRNPHYRIVDQISISCDGPVYSVVLAHRGELSEVEEIVLDPASLTSAALLRCLFSQRNQRPRFVHASSESSALGQAQLLIGDQAIRFRSAHSRDFQFWDLGQAWKGATGLPFVFALWLVRPEMAKAEAIAAHLRQLRDGNLRDIDALIAEEKDFDHDFCRRYFRDHLRFHLGEKEKLGLQTFAASCLKHGLIPQGEPVLDLI